MSLPVSACTISLRGIYYIASTNQTYGNLIDLHPFYFATYRRQHYSAEIAGVLLGAVCGNPPSCLRALVSGVGRRFQAPPHTQNLELCQ